MSKRYDSILADPPWWYAQRSKGAPGEDKETKTKFGGGASAAYPLMRDEDLFALAPYIKAMAAKNASIHMWATGPKLGVAIQLMEACGFKFKTVEYVWVKINAKAEWWLTRLPFAAWLTKMIFKGTGSYTQSNAEFLLLGVKGKIPIYVEANGIQKPPQVILAAHPRYPADFDGVGEDGKPLAGKVIHSRKPAIFRDLIASTRPNTAKVELFCRDPAPGWDVYGNDIDGRDIREALIQSGMEPVMKGVA